MSSFIELVKIQLLSLFSNSTMRFSLKKKGFTISAVLLPVILFLYISCTYTMGIMMVFPPGSKDIALYLMSFMSFTLLLVFAFYSANGHLFGFKDYDLLSSLPISKGVLMTSKLLSFYLLEFFYSIFLYYPALFIYGVTAEMGILYYVMGLINGLFMPLLPIVLSSLFSLVIALISKKFKYSNVISNFLSLVMIGLVFVGVFTMQGVIGSDGSALYDMKLQMITFIPFVGLTIQGVVEGNFLAYFLGIIIQVIPFGLFIMYFAKNCTRINSSMKVGYRTKNYQLKGVRGSSAMKALIMKEIRRYFSCASYVINTLIGPIMVVIATGYALIQREQLQSLMSSLPSEITQVLYLLVLVGISGLCMMSCTTNSSISLEGKGLWIIKSAPVSTQMIFQAKIALNLLILVPFMSLSTLVVGIVLKFSIIEILLILLAVIFSSWLTAQFGLIMNLHYPRFDWDKEIYVVKQSIAVMISVFAAMGFLFGCGFLVIQLIGIINPLLLGILLNLVFMLLNGLCFFYLKIKGTLMFTKL